MKQRRAFTNEWMIVLAIVGIYIALWSPLVERFTGWSHPICFGVLTLLAFVLMVLCGVVQERNPQKAHVLAKIFLAAPAVLLLLLLLLAFGGVLWRKLF